MIKKISKVVATIIACGAFVMMTAEADSAGTQVLVSVGSMAVLFACYKILERLGTFKGEDNVEI